MKIGLVRHFKVNHPFPEKRWLSKSDVIAWFEQYDNSGKIEYNSVNLGNTNWKRCYSSPMLRAANTANHIYHGEIISLPELKELDILHQLSNRITLPFLVWGLIVRIKSFSSNQDTNEFKNRIIAFIDNIMANSEGDVLIVSHWFVMRVIRKELVKRGMVGDNFRSNDYGILYVYENMDKTTNR